MGKKLAESNIHLRDTVKRQRTMARNIETSSAIEGIYLVRDAVTGRFKEAESAPPSTRTLRKKAQ